MGGWGCPHEVNEHCKRLKRACRPGLRGCILYGKVTLREPEAEDQGKSEPKGQPPSQPGL